MRDLDSPQKTILPDETNAATPDSNSPDPFNRSIQDIFALRSSIDGVFFKAFLANWTNPLQLNRSHLLTLILLSFQSSCPMSRISDRLGLEKGSFTAVAGRLLALDLIVRRRDAVDKRVYNLTLTPSGKELAEQVKTDHIQFIRDKLSGFDPADTKRYFAAVTTLLKMTRTLV